MAVSARLKGDFHRAQIAEDQRSNFLDVTNKGWSFIQWNTLACHY